MLALNTLIRTSQIIVNSSLLKPLSIARLSIPAYLAKISVIKRPGLELKTNFNDTKLSFDYTLSGKTYKKSLPYVWLRSNCRCSQCYNSTTEELEMSLLDVTTGANPVEIIDAKESDRTEIVWSDNHKSSYNLVELCDSLFESEIRQSNSQSKPVFWNNKSLGESNGFPSVDYEAYLRDDDFLRKALQSIVKYGAVIINNVPERENEIITVCERIAPIQNSIFGAGNIIVTKKLGFTDRAYTSMPLGLHNDTIWMKNSPGLEAFHVIKKADEGGESVFLDGFYCANLLKQQDPKAFEVLTNTHVQAEFFKKGEYDLRFSDPLIKLNPFDGELMQIRFNPYYHLNVSYLDMEKMIEFYRAIKKFVQILEDRKNCTWIGLEQNQIVIFDNFRLLHGRAGFNGDRTLITTYMPRDEWLSKARLMKAF